MRELTVGKAAFFLGLILALTPWVSPPIALVIGLAFGLVFVHPFRDLSEKLSKLLLQLCVVGLGFGMSIQEVMRAGYSGLLYTSMTILFVLILGLLLGKSL